jgi:hypothetical protein
MQKGKTDKTIQLEADICEQYKIMNEKGLRDPVIFDKLGERFGKTPGYIHLICSTIEEKYLFCIHPECEERKLIKKGMGSKRQFICEEHMKSEYVKERKRIRNSKYDKTQSKTKPVMSPLKCYRHGNAERFY